MVDEFKLLRETIMKIIILDLLDNFWMLLTSIAIYILLGVLLAGVFKYFLPDSFIRRHMGGEGFIANIKAAIIGIPLPLCSCSIIPFISALKKSGASKSAIQTFLISTPITGIDSMLATYGVMGWLFTAYRTLASVVISLFAGFLSLIFIKEESTANKNLKINQYNVVSTDLSGINTMAINSSCCPLQSVEKTVSSCCAAPINKSSSWMDVSKGIVTYAFDDIFKDIAKSLLIGIVLGAVIMTFMPENLSSYLSNSLVLNYVLILLIAMPLYVCATSSVPMGLALLAGGFTPGAVFIFLTAGPATNVITMSVITKTLGKTSLAVYLFSILAGSLIFAFILDYYFSDILTDIMAIAHDHENIGFIEQISAVILLYLSFKYIFKKNATIFSSSCGGCADSCG